MDALENHWPEYLIEGACLGLFMISAFSFGTIFEQSADDLDYIARVKKRFGPGRRQLTPMI